MTDFGVLGTASMGPRLFSRGMLDGVTYSAPTTQGFNGAAAVQPRNVLPRPVRCVSQPSFNGAAAVQPRNGGC